MQHDEDDSLEKSHQLSRQQTEDAISPHELAAILNQNGVRYVLIGGHALAYLTRSPRATIDVDVLISNVHVTKAVQAIQAKFPDLTAKDLRYNVRFSRSNASNGDRERIDLVRCDNLFFKKILDSYARPVTSKGQVIHIPSVEAGIAMKFAAAISPNRGEEDRLQDRVDLIAIIRKHPTVDPKALEELGDLIYPGGGKELCELATAIGQGKRAPF